MKRQSNLYKKEIEPQIWMLAKLSIGTKRLKIFTFVKYVARNANHIVSLDLIETKAINFHTDKKD